MTRDPMGVWYSAPAIAARFVKGVDVSLAERTIVREIQREPALKAAAVRKFGHLWLPWRVIESWLQNSDPPAHSLPPKPSLFVEPVAARTEGELTRKLSRRLERPEEVNGE